MKTSQPPQIINHLLFMIIKVLIRISAIFQTIIICRFISNKDYGTYTLFITYAFILMTAIDFGSKTSLIYEICNTPEKIRTIWGANLSNKILLTIFIAITALLFDYHFIKWKWACIGWAFIFSIQSSALSCLQALKRFKFEAYLSLGYAVTSLTLTLFLLSKGYPLSLIIYVSVAITSISCAIAFLYCIKITNLPILVFKKKTLISTIPFFAVEILRQIQIRSGILLCKHYSDYNNTAFYSVGETFIQNIRYIPTVLATICLPFFSTFNMQQRNSLDKLKPILLATIGVGIITIMIKLLIGKQLILMVFGNQYSNSIEYMYIQCIAVLPACLNTIFLMYHLAINNITFITLALSCSIGLSILFSTTLINTIGLSGIAYATTAAEWILLFAFVSKAYVFNNNIKSVQPLKEDSRV